MWKYRSLLLKRRHRTVLCLLVISILTMFSSVSSILILIPFLFFHLEKQINSHIPKIHSLRQGHVTAEELQVRPTSHKRGRQARFVPFFAPPVPLLGTTGAFYPLFTPSRGLERLIGFG